MNVRVFTADDWQTLYVNGEKVAENHSIDIRTLADYIDGCEVVSVPENVEEAMSYYGEPLPDSEEELRTWARDLVARYNAAKDRESA